MSVVPFLKWPGGKRWLVANYLNLFPKTFNTYFEPFLGSGSIFFALQPKTAVLSDSNSELINTYHTLRDDWQKVLEVLKTHQDNHCSEHYYMVRASDPIHSYDRAARFLYLNRTCWNGLYRVNLKGKFNVPIGTKSAVLHPNDNFGAVSSVLESATLFNCDFKYTLDLAKKGDFVFVDPPYTVNHNNNGFLKYNEKIFSWDDQVRLSGCLKDAASRGVQFLMTNANHKSIAELYKDFDMLVLERNSVIAGTASMRKKCEELIIRG
jgi:DNA adenine methylase